MNTEPRQAAHPTRSARWEPSPWWLTGSRSSCPSITGCPCRRLRTCWWTRGCAGESIRACCSGRDRRAAAPAAPSGRAASPLFFHARVALPCLSGGPAVRSAAGWGRGEIGLAADVVTRHPAVALSGRLGDAPIPSAEPMLPDTAFTPRLTPCRRAGTASISRVEAGWGSSRSSTRGRAPQDADGDLFRPRLVPRHAGRRGLPAARRTAAAAAARPSIRRAR